MGSSELTKKYYKIKDVAEIIGVNQTTLRFWESEFPELSPLRSPKNQRYYTVDDIETLRLIYYLVKVRRLKIDAAKEQIRLNRRNISRRMDILDRLNDIRDELAMLLRALNLRESEDGEAQPPAPHD